MVIVSEIHQPGVCPCGAQPRTGSLFCGPDCEPDLIADPSDPWGFLERQTTAPPAQTTGDPSDPWLHP